MPNLPGEVEIEAYFRAHQVRMVSAGLRIQFHHNQPPGIHFKVEPPREYRAAIVRGIQDGLALRFPDLPDGASVWVTGITADPVESSSATFYQVARMVVDLAHSRITTAVPSDELR
jgi:hypothetical protein